MFLDNIEFIYDGEKKQVREGEVSLIQMMNIKKSEDRFNYNQPLMAPFDQEVWIKY